MAAMTHGEIAARLRALADEIEARGAPEAVPRPTLPADTSEPAVAPLAWGARVSSVFRDRIRWTADDLDLNADYLMACIAFESGETFRPDIRNAAGSGATGLIQFMSATARGLGTTTDELARMTAEDQIVWIWRYFKPFRGRLRTLSDHYMAILLPSAVGEPESHALFSGGVAYRQNSGLDANHDGKVTKGEASAKVLAKLQRGLQPENMA